MKPSICGLLLCFGLVGASASAAVDDPTPRVEASAVPDATITLSGGVIALGVGYEWVRGTLNYQGKRYAFRMHGMSILDIGAARISGSGEVFNLKSVADFDGTYGGTTFGSAVARGTSLALVKNERGVTIRARSVVSGVRFNFSGNGMRVRLDPPSAGSGQRSSKVTS